MEPRNVIVWMFLPVLVVLVMSTGVQAQELREVPASEILEKIQAGKDVNYTNVRVTGEFDLSEIDLETVPIAWEARQIENWDLEEELKIVESEIVIRSSVFENNTNFSNTQFKKPVDFRGTSFLGISDFRGVSFGSDADFLFADFGSDADFRSASFGGAADFRSASFGGYTCFWYADFGGDTYFVSASFGGATYFWSASFGGAADFRDTSFDSDAYFWSASFGGDADFRSASFGGDADFRDTSFDSDAYFWSASFGGDADFDDGSFVGDAIFNSAEFNKVSFFNRTFSKVDLNETDFKSMKVEWRSLKDALIFNGPTYIKLIKNFREMEQFKDADDSTYQYRRLRQANREWSFSKLGDIFIWLSCGYGVRPWRAPAWGAIIIFIFSLIYMPGTLNFWPFTLRYGPFTLFDWLRESGIRRLKESDEGDEQDASCCEVLYSIMALLTMIGLILLFCNLGVKPHYTAILAAILAVAMLLIYALIYQGSNINKQDASFCDAFYFSVITFTTLGYGDWYPKDRYRMFAMIEGLAGWIVLALFLVTLANVMIRP